MGSSGFRGSAFIAQIAKAEDLPLLFPNALVGRQ